MNTLTPRTDWTLLRRYVESNSQDAFAALVSRHLNMVYTACLRELQDASLAEDAAQSVFIILAAKAPKLSAKINLAGWLFQTARFAAKNARTRQTRRERREMEAMRRTLQARGELEQSAWDNAEPLIDQAVAKLSPGEREAILLRYWDNLRLAEVGASLGVSEEAARKRVTRALTRLRVQLERQGVALGAATLAAALSAKAAHSAPPALAPAITRITFHTANAGLVNFGLITPAAQQLSKGTLRAMKVAQLKTIGAVAASVFGVGAITAGIVHGNSSKTTKADLNTPVIGQINPAFDPGAPPDAYRNVLVSGKLVYDNGKPAARVAVAAQIQVESIDAQMARDQQVHIPGTQSYRVITSQAEKEQGGNNTVTRADGTYTLPIGNDIAYNVMVFDNTGKWVAPALEGVTGQKNAKPKVADLVLTKGAVIEGTITTIGGLPVPGSLGGGVMTYNPSRPNSSAAVDEVKADVYGHYRIRVAPGVCRVYTGNASTGLGHSPLDDQTVTVAPGEIKTVNLQVP